MLGIALEFLLKGLGFGKMVLGFLWDIIKGICGFAVEKPFQFLTIVLSLALVYAGWYGANTTRELTQTKKIVDEKVQFIEKQGKTLASGELAALVLFCDTLWAAAGLSFAVHAG